MENRGTGGTGETGGTGTIGGKQGNRSNLEEPGEPEKLEELGEQEELGNWKNRLMDAKAKGKLISKLNQYYKYYIHVPCNL